MNTIKTNVDKNLLARLAIVGLEGLNIAELNILGRCVRDEKEKRLKRMVTAKTVPPFIMEGTKCT